MVEDPVPGAPGQPYLDLEPDSSLDQRSAAAVRYRIVVGPLAGRRTMTLHDPTMAVPSAPSKPFTVSRDGMLPTLRFMHNMTMVMTMVIPWKNPS